MAKLNKGQRQLHHTSASSIGIAEGFPNVKEGNEGDITLRHIRGKGVYIFVKFRNRWYSRQLLSGQGRNTGVKESNLENPSNNQQLNFYDPQSGETLPVNTENVFDVKFGSPGKLSLKLGASGATSLNEVNANTSLTDTSIKSYAIDTSVIEEGNTLTVGHNVEFAVTEVDRDMSQIESDISNNASEVVKANSTASSALTIANSALEATEVNQENIDLAISSINSLTSLISDELGVNTDEITIG